MRRRSGSIAIAIGWVLAVFSLPAPAQGGVSPTTVPPNREPVATPQSLGTNEDAPLTLRLAGSDPDGDALTFSIVRAPGRGRLEGTPPDLVYVPDPNRNGGDEFYFRVSDGTLQSPSARVAIQVAPVNDPPTAVASSALLDEDGSVDFRLQGDDIDSPALTFRVVAPPAEGTTSGTPPVLTYRPRANFHGSDRLYYVANDGQADSAPAMVSFTVRPKNDFPTITTTAPTPSYVGVEYRYDVDATDIDGDVLRYALTRRPTGMTIDASSGLIRWTPTLADRPSVEVVIDVTDPAGGWAKQQFILPVLERINQAPSIVSTAQTTATELTAYAYDVDATDPDGDTLAYRLDAAPAGMSIDASSGLIGWTPPAGSGQPLQIPNPQCFVVPPDAGPIGGGLLYTPPLYQRVRSAIQRGSGYTAPQTVNWDRSNGCLGCHVQTQTVLGLQASKDKAQVDEVAAESLLAGLISSQQPDGSIRRSHPEFAGTQTAFAVWALSYVPDRPRTLEARRRALDYLWNARRSPQGSGRLAFTQDHNSGWLSNAPSMTTLVALSSSRYIADVAATPGATPAQLATAATYSAALPDIARYLLATTSFDASNNLFTGMRMLGLGELRPRIGDPALASAIDAEVLRLDALLRGRQRADGGWAYATGGSASDPMTSAWVGFGLDVLHPASNDAGVRANIEYLLSTQQADGTWGTNSGLFSTRLASTGLVMAYLPIALQRLGSPDLTLGRIDVDGAAGARSLTVTASNRGLAAAAGPVRVRFYEGPVETGLSLGEVTLDGLVAGQTRPATIALGTRVPAADVHAVIEASPGTEECIANNNRTVGLRVVARASDPPGLFDTQWYLLNVVDANAPPTIVSTPVTLLELGKPYEHRVLTSDPDVGDAVTYALATAPVGLAIDERDGRFYYEPGRLAAGQHAVTVRVRDLRGATAQQSFILQVIANRAPVFTSSAPIVATVGQPYVYAATANDPDGDALTFTLVASPLSMSVDPNTGIVGWTPLPNESGSRAVSLRVSDGRGGQATQAFTITVGQANAVPAITTLPPLVATTGVPYAYDVDATDADGDPLVYALTTAPAGMSIDGGTGRISWTPTQSQLGAQAVEVRVSDGRGGVASQPFSVSVAQGNRAPVIGTVAPTAATTGVAFVYAPSATDADGDPLAWSVSTAPAGMTVDAVTGRLTWTPDAAQVGANPVVLRVDDGRGGRAEQAFTVQVAQGNRAPSITSTPALAATVGIAYVYDVDAVDPDGDTLAYSLDTAPGGMTIDAATGRIAWSPAAAQVGNAPVTVRATDPAGAFVAQGFTVVVNTPANANPVFTTVAPTVATATLPYDYDADATDADGDPVRFALVAAPAGMTVDADTGRVRWTPGLAQTGSFPVVLQATDGRGGSASQSFTVVVAVAPPNAAPSITTQPFTGGKAGRAYRYDADATDPESDALSWSLASAPSGMTVDAATGIVAWTPPAAGTYPVVLRVSDGRNTVQQSWSIVALASDVPLATTVTVTPTPVAPGGSVRIVVSITGAAAPTTVTATLGGSPLALDADGDTTITAPSTPGCRALVVTTSDGFDNVVRSSDLCVTDPSDVIDPVVTILAPADNAEVGAPTPVRGSATDANLAEWELSVRPSNSPTVAPTRIARGTSAVTDQVLGTFDPTLLINGQYTLFLTARDLGGRTATTSTVVRVTGDMKVGHFTLSFEDASIPVAGIPVRVTRTYDTRRRGESLDFGHGWSVDYQNVRIAESTRPGFSWRNYRASGGPFGNWCTVSNGDRVVTVTLPDGQVESFRARVEPECNPIVPVIDVNLVFTPIDGTDSRLEQTDYGLLRVATIAGSEVANLIDLSEPGEPVDPRNYRLTTAEGVIYEIDQDFGVRRVVEPSGNSLTYSAAGIRHSSGVGIDFVRDGQGRIRDLVLPDGEIISYTYTAAGDLEAMVDQIDQVTRFAYQFARIPHYLTEVVDPRGVRAVRNEYDDDGRLVATIDADGRRIEYTHNVAGRTQQVRDRRGNLRTFVYDANGWVLSETNALGETTQRTYDGDGNVLSLTDPTGRTTQWTYDARGNRLSERNGLGQVTTMTYNAANGLLTEADALGNVLITNTFNSRTNAMLSTRDALGNTTIFSYDSGIGSGETGEPLGVTDARGRVTRYEVDVRGRRLAETDPDGVRTTWSYDSAGRVTNESRSRTVGAGSVVEATRFAYDGKGRLLSTTLPDGSTITTTYNSLDKPVSQCDAMSRCTVTSYDANGHATRIDHPDGTHEAFGYDGNGNQVSERDRGGRVTRMVYDAADRLVERIFADDTPADDADNPRRRWSYDGAGRIIAEIDENGRRTEYRYDAAGRLIERSEPAVGGAVATTTNEYDAAGRLIRTVDPAGRATTFDFDAAGKSIRTTFADGGVLASEYDVLGRKTAEVDPAGRRTEYAYDALGRLSAVTQGAGSAVSATTTFQYDQRGNRIGQTDAEGRTTRWTFDALGRETGRTLPGGRSDSRSWNAAGQPSAATDFAGRTKRWTYDASGRLTGIDYATDPDVSFVLTPAGQRARMDDSTGTTTQSFDARDRLVRRTDSRGRTIDYAYDAVGNLVSRTTANQSHTYAYDERNRLVRVTSVVGGGPARITSYTYDAAGNRTAMVAGDGTRTEYTYDSRHRLIGLGRSTGAGALQFAADYILDGTGLRTRVVERDEVGPLRTIDYAFDAQSRLQRETIDHRDDSRDRESRWTHDRVGNRTSQVVETGPIGSRSVRTTTNTYDVDDRLLRESEVVDTGAPVVSDLAYDDNGNLVRRTTGATSTEFLWDEAGRMVEQREGGTTTRFVYDGEGRRIARTVTPAAGVATTTEYLVDPTFAHDQVIERFERSGAAPFAIAVAYTFGDAILAQTGFGAAAGERFVHADGFGSTRMLTDSTGVVTDRIDYDAYGVEIARSGSTVVEHLYRGEQYDASVGRYFLRARYYDPNNGRFDAMDSFPGLPSDPRSLHKYGYANGSPTQFIDPSGHFSLGESMGALNTMMTLSLRAVSFYTNFIEPFAIDDESERPTVFDAILAYAMQGAASSLNGESLVVAAAAVAATHTTENHHVIPVYMCGKVRGQPTCNIPRLAHYKVHRELDMMTHAVNILGRAVIISLKRRTAAARSNKTPMQWAGRTVVGRGGIVALLQRFYASNGWGSQQYDALGSPNTIGGAMKIYAPLYAASRSETSWRSCSR